MPRAKDNSVANTGNDGVSGRGRGRGLLSACMPLEDHIGDICRKARLQTQTALDAAANAAGVAPAVLEHFESEGVCDAKLDVAGLAHAVGLNAAAAVRIATGWEPRAVDVARWSGLGMLTTKERFLVNSFVAWDAATLECALFDTGWYAADFFALVERHGLRPQHLFITHTHGDHVAALGEVRRRFPDIALHSNSSRAPAAQRVGQGQVFAVGDLRVESRLTPGHAEDGVTYVVSHWPDAAPLVAVAGDTIFAGSLGKDFNTPELAQRAVREQILSLPLDTLICPGHGPLTTVGEERENNPFFA